MSDLMTGNSGYATGAIDTATTQENENLVPISGEASAAKINGPATAIVQMQGILGVGPDLKGSKADLVERLAVGHQPNGDHKTLDVFEGGTGSGLANMGMRYLGLNTTTMQFVEFLRHQVFTSSGTFTVPAGVTSFFVECYGAGGGGGGGGGGAFDGVGGSVNGGNGAKGTYGSYSAAIITGATPADTYTVTVGAAGTAGNGGNGSIANASLVGSNAGAGGNGGASSFFVFCVSGGGIGGAGGTGATTDGAGNGTAGTSGSSELLAVGVATAGSILLDGHGSACGAGAAGGGPGLNGASGGAGKQGKVVVWY